MQKPPIHSLCHSCAHVRRVLLGDARLDWRCGIGQPDDDMLPEEPMQPVRSCPEHQPDEATREIQALESGTPTKGSLKLIVHCSGNAAQVRERAKATLRDFLSTTQGRYFNLPTAGSCLPKHFLKRLNPKGVPHARVWQAWLEEPDTPLPMHKLDSLHAWLAKMDYRRRDWRWEADELIHPGRLSIQIRLLHHGKVIPDTLRTLLLNNGAIEIGFA